jgi:hypothetical protein
MNFLNVCSPQLRGAQYISPGKTVTATGTFWMSNAVKGPPPPCAASQYERDEEAPVFVSQYNVIASSISSRVSDFWALRPYTSTSRTCHKNAAIPTGESARLYPRVCSLVFIISA